MARPAWKVFHVDELRTRIEAQGAPYLEFLRVPDLSCGIYKLPVGATDMQAPHDEDEVYYVLSGQARLRVEGAEHEVRPGTILYVRATSEHSFFEITEGRDAARLLRVRWPRPLARPVAIRSLDRGGRRRPGSGQDGRYATASSRYGATRVLRERAPARSPGTGLAKGVPQEVSMPIRTFRFLLLLALLSGGATAASADDGGCDAWFPDIQCERSGRWEGFRKPIVSPYLFEDPFITTGTAIYYVRHEFPDSSALGGGEAQVAAAQLRVALTDRVALIATKDGRAWVDPGLSLLDDREGWMNLAGGLKVMLAGSEDEQWIVSGVLRYEAASGSRDVLQGHGSGVILPSISAAIGSGRWHFIGDVGMELPIDSDEQSTSIFYHLYLDYAVTERFSPFVQLSGMHWVRDGDGSIPVDLNIGVTLRLRTVQAVLGTDPAEGADVLNIGSPGIDGEDLLTAAAGFHYALNDWATASFAYERPITSHEGLLDERFVAALVLEF